MASAPFVTDDSGIVGDGLVQVQASVQGTTNDRDGTNGAAGLEVDLGIGGNTQIGVVLPVGFSAPNRSDLETDSSVLAAGIKYQIASQSDDGWMPSVAFEPSVQFSLHKPTPQMADSGTHFFFPLWAERTWSHWAVFGGGGYRTNPGADGRDSVFSGAGVTRNIDDHVSIGMELFGETAIAKCGTGTIGSDIGANYAISNTLAVQLAIGAGMTPRGGTTNATYFAGIQWVI
ncbi:MAG TPA: hypothetical protein VMF58_13565 [Rhizomicrobium sp.]|nr:hypothetical protein [Rhizomicrobium sp.]